MKTRFIPMAMLALLLGWFLAAAPHSSLADEGSTNTQADQHPYLGVGIEPLHPSMASHLPDVLIPGQGVLVSVVTPDSPAAKAGIQPNDILVKYGDQKLFSAEQMVKLVMASKVGEEIQIELVRSGKLDSVRATLGESPAETRQTTERPGWQGSTRPWLSRHFAFPWFREQPRVESQNRQPNASSDWQSFDSMTLKKLDDGKFRAEIQYLNDEGKMEHHTFQGTRDEVTAEIKAETDLPTTEREHLLHGIESPEVAVFLPGFQFGPDITLMNGQPYPSDF